MLCVLTNLLRHFGANEIMKGPNLSRLPGPNLSRLLEVLLEFVECCQVCNTVKMFPCCNTQVTWIKMKQQQQQYWCHMTLTVVSN
ncbi:hypothetical protein Pmani_018593 [Petrolisthes manimaculis]|uniref:Uncharacterized protein n=1 Tax=Petrolisthes manimaculis TaxID=1843537 RepID=A0AAE1U6J7_9EUCA|nr:hypothetical protein Pmani_018593 [Petrolisthes manimaculis]